MIAEIDLDFVDLFEDLFCVGFDIRADEVDVVLVVGFVEEEVLFHVCEFDVDLGDADLHVDPDRDDGYQECEQANGLSYGHSEDCVFCGHRTSFQLQIRNEELRIICSILLILWYLAIEGDFDHFDECHPAEDNLFLTGHFNF